MQHFEYKAIPAPTHGTKAKGVKSTEDRYALTVTDTLNEMAEDGWDFVRAETLPCTERKGLTGSQTVYQNLLIFRRRADNAPQPLALERPVSQPAPQPVPMGAPAPVRADPPVSRPRVVSEDSSGEN